MRIIAYIGLSLLVIVACLAGLIYFAASEAISPSQLAPAAILEFPQFKRERVPGQSLKIVTYNIGYASGEKNNQGDVLSRSEIDSNLATIAHTLSDLDADIICLQEVDFYAQRSFNEDQLQVLAKRLKMPYAAYVVTWNKKYIAWPYWPPQHHFGRVVSGQAVLSRYPIVSQDLLYFAKPASNAIWYNWFYLNRIAQRLSVKIANSTVEVWNLHLEAFDKTARDNQLTALGKILNREQDGLRIVAGDYNTASLSVFMKEAGLSSETNKFTEKTFPSWDPQDDIDHILYRGLTLETAGIVPGVTASDHLPLWAVFRY